MNLCLALYNKELDDAESIVAKVFKGSLFWTFFLTSLAWIYWGWVQAQSVLIGAALVNASFFFLQRDIKQVMHSVAVNAHSQGFAKTRFFLKWHARLLMLALLLFVVASKLPIEAISLGCGVATIVLSIVSIGVGRALHRLPSNI